MQQDISQFSSILRRLRRCRPRKCISGSIPGASSISRTLSKTCLPRCETLPGLTVRRNYLTDSEPANAAQPPAPPSRAETVAEPPAESLSPSTAPERSVFNYAPQQTTIIVVNANPRHRERNPCAGNNHCPAAFRPNFNDRRYVHPSVFNGGSRQYIQP